MSELGWGIWLRNLVSIFDDNFDLFIVLILNVAKIHLMPREQPPFWLVMPPGTYNNCSIGPLGALYEMKAIVSFHLNA